MIVIILFACLVGKNRVVLTTLNILPERALSDDDSWAVIVISVNAPLCGVGFVVIAWLFVRIHRLRKKSLNGETKPESANLRVEELPPSYQDAISAIYDYSAPPAYHSVIASRV